LTVSDGNNSSTRTETDYITVSDNVDVDFEADVVSGTAPLTVHFTDLSGEGAQTWQWDFGNGGWSSQQNPTYYYYQSGVYTVSLTIGGFGCENTETKVDYIVVEAGVPIPEFSADPTMGTVPLTVNFSDESYGEIDDWQWDFGDGNTSEEENPVHEYTVSGLYSVTLIVTGPGGSDTLTRTDLIDARDILTVDVSAASDELCVGETTQLFADALGGSGSYTFSWTSDPEGFVSNEQNPEVSPEETTTYFVGVDDGNEIINGEITITVHPIPEIALGDWPEILCNEQEPPVQLTATPEGGAYSGNNVTEDGVFTPEEAPLGWNVITYTYSDEYGCENMATDSIYVDECVGVITSQQGTETINIYPNPNKGTFTVSAQSVIEKIIIVDLRGTIVATYEINDTSARIKARLSKGTYFIRVITEDNGKGFFGEVIIK
jgi:PKD repeat protein